MSSVHIRPGRRIAEALATPRRAHIDRRRPPRAASGRAARLGAALLAASLLGGCDGPHPDARDPGQRPAAAGAELVAPPDPRPLLEVTHDGGEIVAAHTASGRSVLIAADERVAGAADQGTSHRPLSSFGPVVSYASEWYYEGGAHPSYGQSYHAVWVAVDGEGTRPADLRRLFADEEIHAALAAAAVATDVGAGGDTLEALLADLDERHGCAVDFSRFFSAFAMTAVGAGRARVEIGLGPACETSRGAFTRIELEMRPRDEALALLVDLRRYPEGNDEEALAPVTETT